MDYGRCGEVRRVGRREEAKQEWCWDMRLYGERGKTGHLTQVPVGANQLQCFRLQHRRGTPIPGRLGASGDKNNVPWALERVTST